MTSGSLDGVVFLVIRGPNGWLGVEHPPSLVLLLSGLDERRNSPLACDDRCGVRDSLGEVLDSARFKVPYVLRTLGTKDEGTSTAGARRSEEAAPSACCMGVLYRGASSHRQKLAALSVGLDGRGSSRLEDQPSLDHGAELRKPRRSPLPLTCVADNFDNQHFGARRALPLVIPSCFPESDEMTE